MKKINKIAKMPIYKHGSVQTVHRDSRFVYKIINTEKYDRSVSQITKDISNYYEQCKKAGVCVPRYAEIPHLVEDEVIVNKYSYEGKTLLDALKSDSFCVAYRSYLNNLKKGLCAGIGLSSFHEQFTFNGKNTVFVDFFIPASKDKYLHYKKKEDGCSYYLVQFSPNSSFLSAMTQFVEILPEKKEKLIEMFICFLDKNKQSFPLALKTIKLGQFSWAVKNLDKLLKLNSKWMIIGNGNQLICYDSPKKLLKNSNNEDLILNLRRQRFFCKQELVKSMEEYKKQHV